MSQENKYNQVQSVKAIKTPSYAENVASILQDLMQTTPSKIITCMERLQPENKKTLMHTPTLTIRSQTNLKVLQKHFNQNIAALKHDLLIPNEDVVTVLKAAALKTLQQENLMIENLTVVEKSIKELISTKTVKETTEKLSSTFDLIKNQHTNVFTKTLASVIEVASSNIGFNEVKSEIISPELTRIVATNPKGINLISEIHTNEEKKVDIVSELVNITDGTCIKIMDDFCKQIETLGVVSDQKQRKPTGGIAQLPFAKELQKQNRKKKREFKNEHVISNENKHKSIQYINIK